MSMITIRRRRRSTRQHRPRRHLCPIEPGRAAVLDSGVAAARAAIVSLA